MNRGGVKGDTTGVVGQSGGEVVPVDVEIRADQPTSRRDIEDLRSVPGTDPRRSLRLPRPRRQTVARNRFRMAAAGSDRCLGEVRVWLGMLASSAQVRLISAAGSGSGVN